VPNTPSSLTRRLSRATVRALGPATAVVLTVVLGGASVQAYAEHEQRGRYPPPGQLVDIGDGWLIHLRTWGADNPGPIIILDAAASLPSSAWANVAQELAGTHRVVAYDRPGMGWSRGGSGPRDARTAAEALAAALDKAGIGPPYVVVGHSYGGLSARIFTHLMGEAVQALVLIDTTHENGGGMAGYAAFYRLRALQGHLGVFASLGHGNGLLGLPAAEAEAGNVVEHWTSHLDATADELEAWPISAQQVRAAGDMGDLPLLVIAAYGSEQQYALQRDLATLSTAGEYAALEMWHTSFLFNPDHAALVAAEIRRFLADAGF